LSAGTEPSEVNPYAVKVMSEIGIDITGHKSKGLEEFIKQDFDYVITGKISQALEGMIFKVYYWYLSYHKIGRCCDLDQISAIPRLESSL